MDSYILYYSVLLLTLFQLLDLTWQQRSSQYSRVDTISDLVYSKFGLNDGEPLILFCNRRFNSTHQLGCSPSAQDGMPYLVDSSDGFKSILDKDFRQYILIINVFDFDIINLLRNDLKVSGVIFYRRSEQDFSKYHQNYSAKYFSFSNDGECPNLNFGFKGQSCDKGWQVANNPFFNFANIDWPFPIFYIQNNSLIGQLFRCIQINKNNIDLTPCRIGLKLKLYGAINSKRCFLRNGNIFEALQPKSYCSPIVSRSIFAPILPIPLNKTIRNDSILVLTARMDSFSMFSSFSPGINSVYSGLIVLITVADILSRYRLKIESAQKDKKLTFILDNVLFAMFDGESFGNVGSASWIFYTNLNRTSKNFLYNITIPKLSHVIEVNQLLTYNLNDENTFWLHANWTNPKMNIFANKLVKFANTYHPKVDIRIIGQTTRSQPPSTIDSFQRFAPNLTAILLTGFNDKFVDPFYHSFLDYLPKNHTKSIVTRLYNLSMFLAEYLYYLLTKEKATFSYDIALVENLTNCFSQNISHCYLFDRKFVAKDVRFNSTTATRSTSDGLSDITSSSPRLGYHVGRTKVLEKALFFATSQTNFCIGYDDYPDMRFIHDGDERGKMMSHNTIRDDKSYNKSCQCLASQARIVPEYSPYFVYLADEDEEIRKWFADNPGMENNFSSLTESDYQLYKQPSIHIFLIPSDTLQLTTLSVGCLILVLSFCIVLVIDQKSYQLFDFGNADCRTTSKSTSQLSSSTSHTVLRHQTSINK